MRSRLKFAVFACTPALVLLIGDELFVRTTILVRPSLVTLPLPGEGKIMVPDEELFWSLRPSHRQGYMGVQVATNELGLRSPPVAPRGGNEYRILSLGESTTFGSRVAARKTYTSLLAAFRPLRRIATGDAASWRSTLACPPTRPSRVSST